MKREGGPRVAASRSPRGPCRRQFSAEAARPIAAGSDEERRTGMRVSASSKVRDKEIRVVTNQQLAGLAVVSIDTGEKLGVIDQVAVDTTGRRIVAFTVQSES